MALQIQTPSTLTLKPYHHHHQHHHHHHHHPVFLSKSSFAIKSQKLSTDTTEPTSDPTPPKKQTSPAQGFGSISSPSQGKSSPSKSSEGVKKKQKGKRERASVIRRSPLEKPAAFISKEDEAKSEELNKNESAFLLAWLGLGGIILVEGILLSASGFLPEEWDNFFVKYLYPLFTPTVFLFVAGTVAYGVSKYLQNEKLKD